MNYFPCRRHHICQFQCAKAIFHSAISMMTSSNGNIFRVTGPLCGEFTGPGEFPTQKPVTRSFDVFFDRRPNKRLSKQSWGWWFETYHAHCDVIVMRWGNIPQRNFAYAERHPFCKKDNTYSSVSISDWNWIYEFLIQVYLHFISQRLNSTRVYICFTKSGHYLNRCRNFANKIWRLCRSSLVEVI